MLVPYLTVSALRIARAKDESNNSHRRHRLQRSGKGEYKGACPFVPGTGDNNGYAQTRYQCKDH
jgi:hypothetical protein